MAELSNVDYYDDLTSCIQSVLNTNNVILPKWYISGMLGLGARITVSMNVKTGKEIGHQSSKYIWDLVAFVENCFIDIGIKLRLYVGQGYINSARKTAAQSSRTVSDNIILLKGKQLDLKSLDPLIIVSSDGIWYIDKPENMNYSLESTDMPFGPIAIQIYDIMKQELRPIFPKNTLKYLISTLERGEEPMEIPGKGFYSAVSGWKAYARWMQAYSVPVHGIKSDYITILPKLILERRKANSEFWKYQSINLIDEVEKIIANKLFLVYNEVALMLETMLNGDITYNSIKQIYFKEQESLTVYKEINNYLKKI